jgi:hypothetical protein
VHLCSKPISSGDLAVVTLLDAGCGDSHWLPTFDLSSISIVGVDIVPELIAHNRLQYPSMRFEVMNFVSEPLPCADLVFCRDGLVHLPNADIMDALGNFQRSGAKWLLTNTFINRANVGDISPGEWRPINLEAPPFSLPASDRTIDEMCLGYDGKYRDKRLALWRCDKIPLHT